MSKTKKKRSVSYRAVILLSWKNNRAYIVSLTPIYRFPHRRHSESYNNPVSPRQTTCFCSAILTYLIAFPLTLSFLSILASEDLWPIYTTPFSCAEYNLCYSQSHLKAVSQSCVIHLSTEKSHRRNCQSDFKVVLKRINVCSLFSDVNAIISQIFQSFLQTQIVRRISQARIRIVTLDTIVKWHMIVGLQDVTKLNFTFSQPRLRRFH